MARAWQILLLALVVVPAAAGGPGALTYRGGAQGPVIFDHQLHASRGQVCRDCHTLHKPTGRQLFQTQKQARITLADHDRQVWCFACHDGAIAFSDCGRCHRR